VVSPDPNKTETYLLDTGILIRHLRGDRRASRLLTHFFAEAELTTSAISLVEVYRGCRTEAQQVAATDVFQYALPVDVTALIARLAGSIIQSNRGVLSGDRAAADAIIAATAAGTSARLITLNTRQFARVHHPGLDILLVDQNSPDWVAAVS
jgi:predicted nucleic acid-binding protein